MKKSIALVFGALLLAASVQAAVVVKQGNKTLKYENGQVVRVAGNAPAVVDYNGVKITIPQGVRAVIRQNKDGSVRLTGTNVEGVTVNGFTVNAANKAGVVSFSVSSDTGKFTVHTGALQVTTPQGQVTPLAPGAVFTPAGPAAAAAAPAAENLPAFVNEALESSTVSQQAVQNVTEEKVLSPSAPR